jgi:hypothetical protein
MLFNNAISTPQIMELRLALEDDHGLWLNDLEGGCSGLLEDTRTG